MDGMPFTTQQLQEGPFDFPPPPATDMKVLYKSLYKLLNYLSVEWCGGDLPTHLRVAFGSANLEECFDLAIVISNSDLHIKKQKLDEVFEECHVLQPFLALRVTTPSLMVTGSLSSYIKHFHKMWVTPRGVLVHEQPVVSREMAHSSVLYIFIDFRAQISPKSIKDLMLYFLQRLNIGCSENLIIDLNPGDGPQHPFHFPGHYKAIDANSTRSDGNVNVKICRACQSCRIQTTKPKEINIKGKKFNVKICTRQCFSTDDRCYDRKFRGKLTILGPGSIPVLQQSDGEFYNQFNNLVQTWPCMSDSKTHLILVFECSVSKKNVHEIMDILHETCFQVFRKFHASFKSSVGQLLGKQSHSNGPTVDIATSSKNLACGISEIVELSTNEDFKKTVKDLLPYDTVEALQESILNKSRQFGIRETLSIEPRPKRFKIDTEDIVVGGFHFSPNQI